MKKFFYILAILPLFLVSCSEEQSYSITNQFYRWDGKSSSSEFFIHECTEDNETVNIQSHTFMYNETYMFTAHEKAIKLKIYAADYDKWVQQVYYLDDNSAITLTGETVLGPEKP